MTTVAEALKRAGDRFAADGLDSPRLQARQLLAKATGRDAVWLYQEFQQALRPDQLGQFDALVERRASGEPLPYLLGHVEFFGRRFIVDDRVLVPRPETEEIVDRALAYARRRQALGLPIRSILDVGSGSGVLALTLACELPTVRVVGIDLSPAALEIARLNRAGLGVERQVDFVQGDLLTSLNVEADLVTANLPYVPSAELERLQVEVRHEPRVALDGGEDGMAAYRRFFATVSPRLAAPGLLIAEIGADQGEAALRLARVGLPRDDARIAPDLSGRDRFVVVERDASVLA